MGTRTVLLILCIAAGVLVWGRAVADEPKVPEDLLTVAESSGFTKTSTSAQVDELLNRLCARSPHMERFVFGKTVLGKEMIGAKIASPMPKTRADLADDPRPVVLVIGNIHSGECAGKEALLMLLRELALDPEHPWLEQVVLLVAPNYNADGNDKMGPNDEHRRGQIGPDEMGTRHNAMDLDLNRDFIKMESPEARALVGLMTAWNPHVFIDCHTTNGSWHRYPLTYDVPHGPAAPKRVRDLLRGQMMPHVTEVLEAEGLSTFYYGNFSRDHTKWTTYGHQPRYSTEYVGLRGRIGILSEVYSYIPYEDRIRASKAFVEACVDWVATHRDHVASAIEGPLTEDVPINAKVEAFDEPFVVKGYVEAERPEGSRGPGPKPTEPKDYTLEFWGRYVPTKSVARPFAYLIPADLAEVAERLQRHGIAVERLTADATLDVQVNRITSATKAAGAFQGHRLVTAEAELRDEERAIPKGTLVVRLAQPLSNLIVYLLEPESDDGLVTWNGFDDHMTVGQDFPVLRVPMPVELLPTEPVK